MKRTQKLCAFLLALLTLLPACQKSAENDTQKPEDNSSTDTESAILETEPKETRPLPGGPEEKFDGEEFRVLYRHGADSYNCNDIVAEDGMTGELINDTVYQRNIKLEDMLGIKFVPIENGTPITVVRKDVRGGDQSYDVVLERMNDLFPAALDKCFGDWYEAPYFDVEKPWWDANCASELSLKKHVYIMASDITMKTSGEVRFLYYNKKLMTDNNLGNPYELVTGGKWTMDEFRRMVSSIAEDLNGDGEMTGADRYGLLKEGMNFFLSGCGVLFTTKDADDLPVVDCINERTVNALEAVRTLLADTQHTCSYDTVAKNQDTSGYLHIWDYGRSRFAAGQFLFVQCGASEASTFAEMEDRYGILPNPKLDEIQTEYYHLIDPFTPAWAYTSNCRNLELASAAMECWGYLSGDLVEAFYETTLKKRRLDVPDDAAMLDIVRSTIRYEISTIYDMGIIDVLNASYSTGNVMSNYQSRKKQIDKKLEKILKKVAD